eukprot:TRINITY_DN92106_c0_g4_i1.p1 TRINITY_DN92106_c0_g4~~TRINITY_DN92106_c0_g4_i1.p1  ORF type:complete len:523 (-),score=175.64 TRINITY_DN92106_c0_g4_i1:1072-2640(-)
MRPASSAALAWSLAGTRRRRGGRGRQRRLGGGQAHHQGGGQGSGGRTEIHGTAGSRGRPENEGWGEVAIVRPRWQGPAAPARAESVLDDLWRAKAQTRDAPGKFRRAGMVAGGYPQAPQGTATGSDVADGGTDDAGSVELAHRPVGVVAVGEAGDLQHHRAHHLLRQAGAAGRGRAARHGGGHDRRCRTRRGCAGRQAADRHFRHRADSGLGGSRLAALGRGVGRQALDQSIDVAVGNRTCGGCGACAGNGSGSRFSSTAFAARRLLRHQVGFTRLHCAHFHVAGTALGDAQAHSGGVTEIDHAAIVERATIIDAHDHRFAVVQVGHAGEAGQRQGLVRSGELVHVVDLAVGGQAAMELGAVVRSGAAFNVVAGVVEHLVLLAQHHVGRLVADRRAVFIGHQRLGNAGHVGHIAGRSVFHAGLVQATGGVVATGRQVLGSGRVRRALRTMRRTPALALHHRAGRLATVAGGRRLLRRAAAGGQREDDQSRDQPSDVHAGGSSCPAMACDNWNTAIAYIFERL